MSIFTNSISAAADEANAYTEAVLALLGDQEPLDVLERLPSELEQRLRDLTDEQLRRPEAPGKWSMAAVVQHLTDSEMMWAYRMRSVLTEDRPPLTGYDQDLWADRLHYNDGSAANALKDLTALRAYNLRLLARLTPDELGRVGVHSERGDESVAHMLKLYAGHDLVHLAQFDRIRTALT